MRVHKYFSDDELWEYLSSLSVSVLPYRFGTHSGWLEACHDLGTAVIAPSCGFYHQQRPCQVFTYDEQTFDPDSLADSVRALYHSGRRPHSDWAQRMFERRFLSHAHHAIYERALS